MTAGRPKVGDKVSLMYPGTWERIGTVVETDYHPLGIEDSVKINFEDTPRGGKLEWWDARWIKKIPNKEGTQVTDEWAESDPLTRSRKRALDLEARCHDAESKLSSLLKAARAVVEWDDCNDDAGHEAAMRTLSEAMRFSEGDRQVTADKQVTEEEAREMTAKRIKERQLAEAMIRAVVNGDGEHGKAAGVVSAAVQGAGDNQDAVRPH